MRTILNVRNVPPTAGGRPGSFPFFLAPSGPPGMRRVTPWVISRDVTHAVGSAD